MNNSIQLLIAFILGQFLLTSIAVYILQKKKEVDYHIALKTYLKAEVGYFIIGVAAIACVIFILPDYLNVTVDIEAIRKKPTHTFKETLLIHFKTTALFIGFFAQLLAFTFLKKGREAIAKFADKDSNG